MRLGEAIKDVQIGSVDARGALKRMRKVSAEELHFYLVLRDTLSATAQETRRRIAFAQVEWERRNAARQTFLTITTTVLSGVLGIFGVLVGIVFANW